MSGLDVSGLDEQVRQLERAVALDMPGSLEALRAARLRTFDARQEVGRLAGIMPRLFLDSPIVHMALRSAVGMEGLQGESALVRVIEVMQSAFDEQARLAFEERSREPIFVVAPLGWSPPA